MKPNKPKTTASAIVALSLLVAACGTNDAPTPVATDKPKDTAAEPAVASAKPKMPLFDKSVELTYFTALDPKVSATKKNYAEIESFALLEKESGVKIKFLHPPTGGEKEQFNLAVSSNDLPDIMNINVNWYNGGAQKMITDGVIIRLNELLDKHAPNFKKYVDDHPEFKKDMVLDDGTFYAFPTFKVEPLNKYTRGLLLRKDWLDNYGLQVPTTIDEWYTVLKTFKEKNPQSIPLTGATGYTSWWDFMVAWGIKVDFFDDGGKVQFGQYRPEYKEFLTTMKKWHDEGLLDPEFATNDAKALDAKVTGHRAGAFQTILIGGMGRYLDTMKGDPNFKLVGAPYPKTKDGKVFNPNDGRSAVTSEMSMISGSSKKAVEAVKWLDIAYSEWGHMLMNFGIEGKSYNMVNGYPKFSDAVMKDPKLPVVNALAQYSLGNASGRFWVEDVRLSEQLTLYDEQKTANKAWGQGSPSLQMPRAATPTAEESAKLASIMADINTYNSEMFLKFVYGKEPLSNFDAYQQRLKQMNIEEALKIQQAALDRYNKRK